MMIVNKMETLKGCFLDMGKASLQKLGSSFRTEELDPPFSTKEWVEKKSPKFYHNIPLCYFTAFITL